MGHRQDFALTEQQLRIVGSRAKRLAVQAGAGAAKTTTLSQYAAARPGQKVLYVAFNKAIQQEAAAKMPPNVVCRTSHSLAYGVARSLFGSQVGVKLGNAYAASVAREMGCSPLAAAGALQTIQSWCASLEPDIGMAHVPAHIAQRLADPSTLVWLARSLWQRMCDPQDLAVRLPHDGYLKLYQLQQPVLAGYDLIAVDEAQDLNLCTFEIMARQDAAVVMVGDAAQGIYAFRGATNALALLDAEERLPLTQSFRFGRGIAALANALLGHFRGADHQPLVGAGMPQRTRLTVDVNRPFAVIARTNATIFAEAVDFLATGRAYHFVGGTEGYKLDKILDAYFLWVHERHRVRDPFLRTFMSFGDLESLAEEADDPELRHLVRVVIDYGHHVPGLIEEIKGRHADVPKYRWHEFGGIFLCTAHKSKGLEFEQVWLADDYLRFYKDGIELAPQEVEPQEVNILYVALTRARAAIRLCASFEEWLRQRKLMPTEWN